MRTTYYHSNEGTCSSGVSFAIEDGRIGSVKFEGGCSGNLQGIAALLEGMDADDARRRLGGIRCGYKATSCPDQLARAIAKVLVGHDEAKG